MHFNQELNWAAEQFKFCTDTVLRQCQSSMNRIFSNLCSLSMFEKEAQLPLTAHMISPSHVTDHMSRKFKSLSVYRAPPAPSVTSAFLSTSGCHFRERTRGGEGVGLTYGTKSHNICVRVRESIITSEQMAWLVTNARVARLRELTPNHDRFM